jgi:hypothetical protein
MFWVSFSESELVFLAGIGAGYYWGGKMYTNLHPNKEYLDCSRETENINNKIGGKKWVFALGLLGNIKSLAA